MAPFLIAGLFSARDGEGRRLFDGASLALEAGELAVLEGRSGGGKSTLLRQLVGMVRTEGVGRELAGEAYSSQQLPRWRSQVTLVAQDAPMLAGTVGENLRFPYAQRCAGGRVVDESRLGELLAATDLYGISEERDVATLSGGERHRLALVRGLLWDPPILVADEPLSGLDEEIAALCFELLLDFARRPDHAVLCVLHERTLTDKADRRLRLEKDRIEAPS
jgi:putative ABC transport system ATP-binding protein